MKAIKIIKRHIEDLERTVPVLRTFGLDNIAVEIKSAITELNEVIAEHEALQDRSCENCVADCSVKNALNAYGEFWDYPCDMGCYSRFERKEKC